MTALDTGADTGTLREDGRFLRGEATREKVLDAAERLFADHGFDGVSIRRIAQEAGVTLGVVGFHGGSKMDLFKTILERRVAPLSAARRAGLARLLERKGDPPTVRELVDAFVTPYLEAAASGDPQWRAYARLIARIVHEDRWYDHVRDLYDPVAREYIAAMGMLGQPVDPARLGAAFVLSVASMLSLVASRVRMAALAQPGDGRVRPPEVGALMDYRETLVDFCAGGLERAVFESPKPA